MAIAYDLVLEDHILARQGVKRRQRPFALEFAEMVRYAVGYQSRAFVTFGEPISVEGWNPHSRRDVMALAKLVRERIGTLYKVLPTALVAASIKPSITRDELMDRIDNTLEALHKLGANLGVQSGRDALDLATETLVARGIIVSDQGRFRVRERRVLRYYARSIQHLLDSPSMESRPN